jgi:hypothetical protein
MADIRRSHARQLHGGHAIAGSGRRKGEDVFFWWRNNAIRPIVSHRQWRLPKEENMNDSVFGFLVAAEMSALFWAGVFLVAGTMS